MLKQLIPLLTFWVTIPSLVSSYQYLAFGPGTKDDVYLNFYKGVSPNPFDSLFRFTGDYKPELKDNNAELKVSDINNHQSIITSSFDVLYGTFSSRFKAGEGSSLTSFKISSVSSTVALAVSGSDPKKVIPLFYGSYQESEVKDMGVDLTKDFHDYTITWTSDKLTWAVDGKVIKTLTKESADKTDATKGHFPYNMPSTINFMIESIQASASDKTVSANLQSIHFKEDSGAYCFLGQTEDTSKVKYFSNSACELWSGYTTTDPYNLHVYTTSKPIPSVTSSSSTTSATKSGSSSTTSATKSGSSSSTSTSSGSSAKSSSSSSSTKASSSITSSVASKTSTTVITSGTSKITTGVVNITSGSSTITSLVPLTTSHASSHTSSHAGTSTTVIKTNNSTITTGVKVVTKTISGKTTSYTTYCPLSKSKKASSTHKTQEKTTSTLVHVAPSTTVIKSGNHTTTTGVTVVTSTVSGVKTIYTTYCPLKSTEKITKPASSKTSSASVRTSFAASTTVIKSGNTTLTTGVQFVTKTVSGIKTIYTTYCPLTAVTTEKIHAATTPKATSKASTTAKPSSTVSHNGTAAGYHNSTTFVPYTSVVTISNMSTTVITTTSCKNNGCSTVTHATGVKIVTSTLSGTKTLYTTYCPLSGTVRTISGSSASTIVAKSSLNAYGSTSATATSAPAPAPSGSGSGSGSSSSTTGSKSLGAYGTTAGSSATSGTTSAPKSKTLDAHGSTSKHSSGTAGINTSVAAGESTLSTSATGSKTHAAQASTASAHQSKSSSASVEISNGASSLSNTFGNAFQISTIFSLLAMGTISILV